MKRLVDETADEFTRSLLVAGIEHRPPAGNKAQVIVALGAGGALGLFSSNAFAWLGTTAGKISAASVVAVGVAGAIFIAAPAVTRQESVPAAAARSSAGASLAAPATVEVPQLAAPSPAAALSLRESPSGESLSGDEPALAPPSGSALPAGKLGWAADKTATKRLSAWRERRLAIRRQAAVSKPNGGDRDESLEATAASAGAASAPSATLSPIATESPATQADLDSEVRLVDEMHWAARHNDREALGRFLQRYRETFPDGQLQKEAAEFAARLEQSDSRTR